MSLRRTGTLLMTALACAVVAQAQQTTGTMRGLVSTKKGDFASGAKVSIRHSETGFSKTVTADTIGTFFLPLLPVGPYDITVTMTGMRTAKGKVRVFLGQTADLMFDLDEDVAQATVEVTAQASTVDTTQTNVVSSVDQNLVEAIPLVSRNFQDLARLTPGVVGGSGNPPRLIVEGGRQIFNAIQIDGANNNSAFFGEQRGGAYVPFTFGADTIKELQVVTNGFDAQYGQAGATVNAITKNGTNELTGSALVQLRRTSWAAKPKPVPYDPSGNVNTPSNLKRYNDSENLNFTIGGPIIKDKLWYFAGVERFTKEITANPNSLPNLGTAGSGLTLQDYRDLLASPLGKIVTNKKGLTLAQEFGNPYEGVAPNPYKMDVTNTVYFGRLDWAVNESHRLVLRVNWNLMDETLLNTSNNVNNAESNMILNNMRALSWVVESNHIWSQELFTENRLQIATERRPMRNNAAPGTPAVQIPGSSGTTVGTKSSTPRESNEITTQFFSSTTWTRGDWTLKGGVDFLKVDVDNQFFQNNAGAFQFSNYAIAAAWANGTIAATPQGSISYNGAISDLKGRIKMWTQIGSFFAQGQYTGLMNKRLNLTFGLRYTKQDFSDNPVPNPNFKGLDQGFGGSGTDPRLAFSYDLFGDNKTVIRGGYGWFTSPTPLLLHSNTMTGNGRIIANYGFSLSSSVRDVFNSGAISAGKLINGSSLRKVSDAELLQLAGSGLFPSGSASATSLWDPENKLSRSKKASLGAEHDLGKGLVLGVKATYVKYENLQYFQNINMGNVATGSTPTPYNDGYSTANGLWYRSNRPGMATIRGRQVMFGKDTTLPGYPPAGFGDVFLVKGDGYGHYRGLTFTATKKWSERIGLIANLTFSKAQDTGSFERGTYSSGYSTGVMSPFGEIGASQLPDPTNPASNYGLGNNDRRMVSNVVAYFPTVWDIDLSMRLLYQSGLPYSVYVAQDLNGDGVANHFLQGHIRNDERQPNYMQVDLRLSRNFKITQRFSIEGIIDIYNLFNKADQQIPTNNQVYNLSSGAFNPAYGKIATPDKDKTREVQMGVRFRF